MAETLPLLLGVDARLERGDVAANFCHGIQGARFRKFRFLDPLLKIELRLAATRAPLRQLIVDFALGVRQGVQYFANAVLSLTQEVRRASSDHRDLCADGG